MSIEIRPLEENELAEADRVFRLAFGTYLGLPDPMAFGGDTDFIRTRWRQDPSAALGAFADGALVGCNFAARWGSFGFFGPLSVRPDLWDQGIAKRLLEGTMQVFDRWGIRQTALFTHPNSPKHVGLYQQFGFWPQYLVALMARPVEADAAAAPWSGFAQLAPAEQDAAIAQCRALTDAIYPGLDLEREVRSVADQQLGDTVLLRDGGELAGFAVCHAGAGSEAGSGSVYVKFGAARPGPGADERFARLLDACDAFAAQRGAERLTAGVGTARREAYRQMLARGYRTGLLGVAMQRPDASGFDRTDSYVLCDLR